MYYWCLTTNITYLYWNFGMLNSCESIANRFMNHLTTPRNTLQYTVIQTVKRKLEITTK